MPPPDLTQRTTVFIGKIGTDDAGYNVVGAPQPRLTIAQALADLASGYNAATPAAVKTIALEPGTYTTPGFAFPPNVFIEADPDAQGGSNAQVIISLTGNVTLSSGWAANTAAVGGFRGVTIRQTTSQNLDFTMPVPSAGNPTRRVTLEDVRTDVDNFIFEATGTGDRLSLKEVIQDGTSSQLIQFSGGTQTINNLQSQAPITFDDVGGIAASIQGYGIFVTATPSATTPGVTFNSNVGGVLARLGGSDIRALTLNRGGAGALTVYADAISIPLTANVTYAGTASTANLIRTTDSSAIAGGGSLANPTATISSTVGTFVNGVATTGMRSDGAPTLPTTISGLNSITSGAGQPLNLATPDTNQNVVAAPNGTGQFIVPAGSAAKPGLGFSGGLNYGVAFVGSQLELVANGSAIIKGTDSLLNIFDNVSPGFDNAYTYGLTGTRIKQLFVNQPGIAIGNASGTSPTITATGTSPNESLVATVGGTGVLSLACNTTTAVAKLLSIASGTNQRAGNLTLVGGTLTVNNTTVTANTLLLLTHKTSGGTPGVQITYTVIAATSFTVNSDNALDTSTFSYFLLEVP